MSLPERMSLAGLIDEFFGEPIELPAEPVPILENIHEYQNLPAGERLVTARSPGYDDPAQGSPVDAVFIQTKRVGTGAVGLLLDVQLRFEGPGTEPVPGAGGVRGAHATPGGLCDFVHADGDRSRCRPTGLRRCARVPHRARA
ncbi:hypothetical protein [Streptosporangium sp. NPDC000396]|uniref:hypothetical protein n=1 Tax=Streptosporangium sp. NPDC000396 TaxID=3366185 RepID=UPI0036878A3E